ncbi:hypothetical protein COCNU_scaffold001984G000010 [Cocos nucifera]|nr:hypothetical protein [Cocos nucifera]
MRSMEVGWVLLGYAVAAEAVMLLLLTLPGLESLRVGLVTAVQGTLKPLLLLLPLCLFLVVQVCWQCVCWPPGALENGCTHSNNLQHEKSLIESNLNAILIAIALLLYWLLFSITNLLVRVHQLGQQLETLKKKD